MKKIFNLFFILYLTLVSYAPNCISATTTYTLHDAAMMKTTEAAELLINQGADINSRDRYGNTPLFTAIQYCNPIMVKFFIDKGAKADVRNDNGDTIWHLAAACAYKNNENIEIINKLLLLNLDLSTVNESGLTPIYIASEYYLNIEMVAALRKKGITEKIKKEDAFNEKLKRPSYIKPLDGSYNIPEDKKIFYQLAVEDCNSFAVPNKVGLFFATSPIGWGLGWLIDRAEVPERFNNCMSIMGFQPKK